MVLGQLENFGSCNVQGSPVVSVFGIDPHSRLIITIVSHILTWTWRRFTSCSACARPSLMFPATTDR